ncbi:hypothetical protein F2P56_018112 [Juglans regia]|uniref:Homeobox domain-containing protein n=2 Tax=Juglans regia TaxID=51240 RepID=A0A833UU26_JUGRE|nr:BEL1-like homeodomain protein 7 isoform X2 [Juglans regia]KAF5462072.1 hypothetical protein F2P56_018112 [Juglans regia]
MATYFQSLSNQRDVLQTPYPGDTKFASYSEPPFHPGNIMMYLNQASSASYSDILSGGSLSPLNRDESVGGRNEMTLVPPSGDRASMQPIDGQLNSLPGDPLIESATGDSQMIPRTQLGVSAGEQNIQCQGLLSLSLGTQMPSAIPVASFGNQYPNPGFANTMLNSKYLKPAQQLLDEVVNVKKALKQHGLNRHQSILGIGLDGSKEKDGRSSSWSAKISSDPGESTPNSFCELSPAEQQDLQNRKTKLLSMLDEVDRRYKQYYNQVQFLVSSVDMVAGCGAAEPYTALALQTISRHFRCLRDAIMGQIQATQRSLGEQDTSLCGQGGIPRLRYVDQHLRQQRALQQFGVMRHAWRPQRGLPESSVSILRAWLFEHFLHPYPKDSEKIMLAKETGLTRNQVANWFINARVRLWKPMVEEMYKEEFGESELNSQSSPENASKAPRDNNSGAFEDRGEELQDISVISTTADGVHHGQAHESKFVNVEINGKTTGIGFGSSVVDDHSLYNSDEINIPHHQGSDGSLVAAATTYDMSELGTFVDGSQVSLALELRHCENDGSSHVRCHQFKRY